MGMADNRYFRSIALVCLTDLPRHEGHAALEELTRVFIEYRPSWASWEKNQQGSPGGAWYNPGDSEFRGQFLGSTSFQPGCARVAR